MPNKTLKGLMRPSLVVPRSPGKVREQLEGPGNLQQLGGAPPLSLSRPAWAFSSFLWPSPGLAGVTSHLAPTLLAFCYLGGWAGGSLANNSRYVNPIKKQALRWGCNAKLDSPENRFSAPDPLAASKHTIELKPQG